MVMGRLGSIAWFLIISFALTIIANWRYLLYSPQEFNPRIYVTPNDEEIVKLVYNLTGGWERFGDLNELVNDVDKMYVWCIFNINPDDKDSEWRMPKETLRARSAKCIDYATLLCSMIKCYTKGTVKAYCIIIKDEETIGSVEHAALQIILPNNSTLILDPAIHYTTGKPKPTIAETLNYLDAVKATLKMRNPKITMIFNDQTLIQFKTINEYIEWIKKV
jgi:hypothetical protein